MQIHHDKHHQTYVTKLQTAISQAPTLKGKSLVSWTWLQNLYKPSQNELVVNKQHQLDADFMPSEKHSQGSVCMQDELSQAVGTRDIPSDVTTAVRNNGGGHWNHSFFWKVLTPAESKEAIRWLHPTS